MKYFNRIFYFACMALVFLVSGCDKTKPYETTIPEEEAHFTGGTTQTYGVDVDPVPVYNLGVGTTNVSSSDRTITYVVSSPSGAIAGTQYTIDNNGTVTIPAGKAVATIDIRANYAAYASGRKDTLIFSLATPSLKPAEFMDTVKLIISGGCSEASINLNDFMGDYASTIETLGTNPPYGPYTTAVSVVNLTSATTGTVVIENIWDNGWGPITFDLDWTDPNNRTAIVEDQAAIPGSDAGDINATYAGQTIAVRVPPAALSSTPGTYSYCNQTFTLKMQLGVTNVGYFNALYTVNVAR